MRRSATVEDLQRWEEHGAVWHALEVSDDHAVVELCACHGEPVDVVQSQDAEFIAFVRHHREE